MTNAAAAMDMANTFKTIAEVALSLTGVIGVVMIVIGGIRYTVSGGDQGSITAAKNTIIYAVVGILVAILGYALITFVIPELSSSTPSPPRRDGSSSWGWAPVGAVAMSASVLLLLRRSSKGLLWIARFSAFWMPADERARRTGERWCFLRDADFGLRLWSAVTLLIGSPITGWRCRRSRRRESSEVRAEMEAFAALSDQGRSFRTMARRGTG